MSLDTETRDRWIFGLGLLGITVELGAWLVLRRTPDPSLTIAFSTMLGLPTVLGRDEKRAAKKGQDS